MNALLARAMYAIGWFNPPRALYYEHWVRLAWAQINKGRHERHHRLQRR